MAIKSLHSEHLEGRWRNYKYRFFVSYSHRDTERVDAFDQRFRRYRLPKELENIWTQFGPPPKTLKPYFRDRRSMGAGHSLDGDVLDALRTSAALIVFCSPNSARSDYVNKEIRLFRELHAKEAHRYGEQPRIFPIIIDGDPASQGDDHCFPDALKEQLRPDGTVDTENLIEPIAADAREEGDGPDSAFYKLLAGLLGVDADLISREDIRREHLENTRFALIATIIALVIVGLTTVLANNAIQERDRWAAQDEMLADRAEDLLVEGKIRRAKLAALEGTNQARMVVLNHENMGWLSGLGIVRPQSQKVLDVLRVAYESPLYDRKPLNSADRAAPEIEPSAPAQWAPPAFPILTIPTGDDTFLGFYESTEDLQGQLPFWTFRIDGYDIVGSDHNYRVIGLSQDRSHVQVFRVSNSASSNEIIVSRDGIRVPTDWVAEEAQHTIARFSPDPGEGGLVEEVLILASGGEVRFINSQHETEEDYVQRFELGHLLGISDLNNLAVLDAQVTSVSLSPSGENGAVAYTSAAGVFLTTFETRSESAPQLHYLGASGDKPQVSFLSDTGLGILTPLGELLVADLTQLVPADDPESEAQDPQRRFADANGVFRIAEAQKQILADPNTSQLIGLGADGAIRVWTPRSNRQGTVEFALHRVIASDADGHPYRWIDHAPAGYSQGSEQSLYIAQRLRPDDACDSSAVGCFESISKKADDLRLRRTELVDWACWDLYSQQSGPDFTASEVESLREELGLEEQPFFAFGHPHISCKSTRQALFSDENAPLDSLEANQSDPWREIIDDLPTALSEAATEALEELIRSHDSPEHFRRTALHDELVKLRATRGEGFSPEDADRLRALIEIQTWSFADGSINIQWDRELAEQNALKAGLIESANEVALYVEEELPADLPLSPGPLPPPSPPPRAMVLYTQVVNEGDRSLANALNASLEDSGLSFDSTAFPGQRTTVRVDAPGVEFQDIYLKNDSIRYYGADASEIAQALAETLRSQSPECNPDVRDLSGAYQSISSDIFELWLSEGSACLPRGRETAESATLDVRYYQLPDDNPEVLRSLQRELAGSNELSTHPAQLNGVPINMVACHPDLSGAALERFKKITIQLLKDKVELRRIAPFRNPDRKRPNRIEILHSTAAENTPLISETQVLEMKGCTEIL
nr:toll/interleukin-1 receptor domain-containing protein [Hyphomonas sp. Mor2]